MNFDLLKNEYPKNGQYLTNFIRPEAPAFTLSKLALEFWHHQGSGEGIPTPITGDASLALIYKAHPGMILSFAVNGEDLAILQLQGGHPKTGYRVTSGFRITDLYIAEIDYITSHPASEVKRIILPNEIAGLETAASELALARYRTLAYRLGLVYSNEDKAFIKDLHS